MKFYVLRLVVRQKETFIMCCTYYFFAYRIKLKNFLK
jgi:hypothetical protein